MEARWHRLLFTCPKCKQIATTTAISFASDGDVLIEGICVTCGIALCFPTTVCKQICRCFEADQTPVPTLKFTPHKDDAKFLKDLGIAEEP